MKKKCWAVVELLYLPFLTSGIDLAHDHDFSINSCVDRRPEVLEQEKSPEILRCRNVIRNKGENAAGKGK